MTFDEAMNAARKGAKVRDDSWMTKGWSIVYDRSTKAYYSLNPITGSSYGYRPTEAHKASTTWRIASPGERPDDNNPR